MHSAGADADGADDDGVTFGTIRVGALGATATVNVQGSAAKLDAWIDFNGDGSWGGPGEQIADSVPMAVGDNTLSFDVPSWAADGVTYARFRLSTAGNLGVQGSAADGEVEDYAVTIVLPTAGGSVSPSEHLIGSNILTTINSAVATDLDRDGDMDVLSGASDGVAWYENDGNENFISHFLPSGIGAVAKVIAIDLDGDGDIDVLSSPEHDRNLTWYENDGAQNFVSHTIPTDVAFWITDIFAADMDGDGDVDVLAEAQGWSLALYENDGHQNFTSHLLDSDVIIDGLSAADLDGDGDLDIPVVSYGRVSWYENIANDTFVEHSIAIGTYNVSRVVPVDLDSDGNMDLVLAAEYSNEIAWYQNDGDGNFVAHSIDVATVNPGASDVFPADIDGDGDVDLVTVRSFVGEINWYENDGSQNFSPHWISRFTSYFAETVYAADMDGDGDLDVLAGSHGKLGWYENSESSGLDYGDAPAPYPTLAAEDGAVHAAVGPTLGPTRETEFDGTHSETASSGYWEEDGVVLSPLHVGQLGATAYVIVQGGPAKLDAWIDFNGDGSWGGPGEQIADSVLMSVGDNTLSFDVPSWANAGLTFARYRLSTAGHLGVGGFAADGEVEDYAVTIDLTPPAIDLNGPADGTDYINSSDHWIGFGTPRAPLDLSTARITDQLGNPYFSNLTSLTTTIGTATSPSGGVHQGDILTATTLVGGITQSYDPITGVLTLSGYTTPANYQTVLRSIRYDNSNTFGGPGDDTVYVYFVCVDAANIQSNSSQGQILVDPLEDIDLDGAGGTNDFATTWTNAGPINISDGDATVKDGQRPYLTGMTVTIGNPHAGDALSAVVSGTNIDIAGVGSTQLLFNAKSPLNTDDLVNWQTVLRTVQYFNALGGPGVGQVFIDFDYFDGFQTHGTIRTTTVNIVLPSPPVIDLNGVAAGTGFAATWTNAGAVNITDAAAATVTNGESANLASITASIATGSHANNVLSANTAGTAISQSYNAGSGVLTLSGTDTVANYQTVLRTIMYNNTGGGPGADPVTVNFVANYGGLISATASSTITIVNNSSVVGRHLFYNQSGTATRYDHNDPAINSFDDLAIATDKTAYLWENPGAATFANVSSYTKGINGIMVDIFGLHGTITAADFIFRVGNNNSPGLWGTANAPSSVSVRAGAGVSGSDRVEIIWAPGTAPTKQWLEVITLANANTGLAQAVGYPAGQGDAFFFGNAPGNTGAGDTAVNSLVNSLDEAAIRANNALVVANIPITNVYDVGRNASVNVIDESAARMNRTNPATVLKYLNLTSAPAAPEADSGSRDEDVSPDGDEDVAGDVSPLVAGASASRDSGVASALTVSAPMDAPVSLPKWMSNRLDRVDVNSGGPNRTFQHLHDVNTPRSRALVQKFDYLTDALGLDDELLDSLLADLGL